MLSKPTTSESRTYVAICNKMNFDGYYFKKFKLPEHLEVFSPNGENNTEWAAWYFLNHLDFSACIDGCYTWEDFTQNIDWEIKLA